MLASAFGVAAFLREGSSALLMNCMFALAGIGWATINVNSFPMVVEMCSGGEIGKFTGYYYTASMAAQSSDALSERAAYGQNRNDITVPVRNMLCCTCVRGNAVCETRRQPSAGTLRY